jgi:hypothetical protein
MKNIFLRLLKKIFLLFLGKKLDNLFLTKIVLYFIGTVQRKAVAINVTFGSSREEGTAAQDFFLPLSVDSILHLLIHTLKYRFPDVVSNSSLYSTSNINL